MNAIMYGDIMKNTLLLVSAVAMLACVDTGKETGETETGTPEVIEYVEPTPTVAWGEAGVSMEIADAEEGAAYTWGIVENFGECKTLEEAGEIGACWTGEDCHRGYALNDGGQYLYCHPISGSSIELSYGAAPDAVQEGTTTVFGDATFSTVTTHILDNTVSQEAGSCWVWGADPTYYDGYAKTCNAM
jgi:hypothetical protein